MGMYNMIYDRSGLASIKWEKRTDEMKARNLMPFSTADMEIRTAPEITEALIKGAETGIYGYTMADIEYRTAVKGWYKRRHNYEFNESDIVCTGGVVQGLYALIREFTQPCEGIIVQPPVYYPFYSAIECADRVIVPNKLFYEGGAYTMNLDELEALAGKPENTMMILCSPHNPVGRVWDPGELRAVADICVKNNVLLISDEIHCDLTRKPHSVITTLDPTYKDNTVVCLSTAKTFNLAGFTTANIVIENAELRDRYTKRLNNEAIGGMTFFARLATIAAYNRCDYWVDGVNAYIQENFELLKDFTSNHKNLGLHLVEMEGTYLAWLDMNSLGLTDKGLDSFMNERALMSVNLGPMFGEGGSGFIRINIAVPKAVLIEALERFGAELCNL